MIIRFTLTVIFNSIVYLTIYLLTIAIVTSDANDKSKVNNTVGNQISIFFIQMS